MKKINWLKLLYEVIKIVLLTIAGGAGASTVVNANPLHHTLCASRHGAFSYSSAFSLHFLAFWVSVPPKQGH